MFKSKIWIAAAASLLVAGGAGADPITGEAAWTAQQHFAAAVGHKASKQAAKESNQARRLAKQCRKESRRIAKHGGTSRLACSAPRTVQPTSTEDGHGNALGQTGEHHEVGTNGNGNGYGLGQNDEDHEGSREEPGSHGDEHSAYHGGHHNNGHENDDESSYTHHLPPEAYLPTGCTTCGEREKDEAVEVPEPATLSLLGLGLLGLGFSGRGRKRLS